MEKRKLPIRRLVAYARPESFAENTLVILRRLGCDIQSPDEFAEDARDRDAPSDLPDLYLVDDGRLGEVPGRGDKDASVPVVLLTREGDAAAQGERDARVVATVRSPAGMHDLYRLLQVVLEETPRSAPRVSTELPVVYRHAGRDWNGTVVSLSEAGCLLRSHETVELGTELLLSLPMPGFGTVHLHAETAYQIKSDTGLVFSSTSPKVRQCINDYVAQELFVAEGAGDPATSVASG